MVFFSLVVPNLNEERYLPLFLESLVNQSFKDFEVIIIDGLSSDKSLDIITSYQGKLNLCFATNTRRNIGYIRNYGSKFAYGEVLFHTSSDTYFEPDLLKKIKECYDLEDMVAVSGRTYPLGTNMLSKFSYQAFDLLRFLFTVTPFPVKKYRPSGNFCSVKRNVFLAVGGFPEVRINEDGLFGQKLDEYISKFGKRIWFNLNLYVGHNVKRFEKVGGIKTVMFYFFVFGNMFPFLKPLLKHIELKSAKIFASRSDLT